MTPLCGASRAAQATRLLLGGALLSAAVGCADPATVTVWGPAGELRVRFVVDVAETAEERRTGLVGREELATGEGLLLVFPVEGEVCISSALVGFPIDAVFADALGHVVAVESGIAAGDPRVRCHAQVTLVLEVSGGAALSVTEGDVLERRP